jgi:transcription termination factor NusB
MEQMIACLLAEVEAEMKDEREEMTARLEDKIEANQEKMDDGQEKMKAHFGSLTSRTGANQEEMKVMLDACLEKWKQIQEKSVAVHEEVRKEEAAVKLEH